MKKSFCTSFSQDLEPNDLGSVQSLLLLEQAAAIMPRLKIWERPKAESGWWSLAENAFQRTRWLVVEQVRVAVFVEPASLLLLPHHPNQPTFEPFFVDNQNISAVNYE